jgi:hypothetical protein
VRRGSITLDPWHERNINPNKRRSSTAAGFASRNSDENDDDDDDDDDDAAIDTRLSLVSSGNLIRRHSSIYNMNNSVTLDDDLSRVRSSMSRHVSDDSHLNDSQVSDCLLLLRCA